MKLTRAATVTSLFVFLTIGACSASSSGPTGLVSSALGLSLDAAISADAGSPGSADASMMQLEADAESADAQSPEDAACQDDGNDGSCDNPCAQKYTATFCNQTNLTQPNPACTGKDNVNQTLDFGGYTDCSGGANNGKALVVTLAPGQCANYVIGGTPPPNATTLAVTGSSPAAAPATTLTCPYNGNNGIGGTGSVVALPKSCTCPPNTEGYKTQAWNYPCMAPMADCSQNGSGAGGTAKGVGTATAPGLCKNLGNDNNNCGTCGNVCGGGKTCKMGKCA